MEQKQKTRANNLWEGIDMNPSMFITLDQLSLSLGAPKDQLTVACLRASMPQRFYIKGKSETFYHKEAVKRAWERK